MVLREDRTDWGVTGARDGESGADRHPGRACPGVNTALLPRLLPPLLERSSVPVYAGAICVNFAISSASCVAVPDQPNEPYDAAGRLDPH